MERWENMGFSEETAIISVRALLWEVFNGSALGSRYLCTKLPGKMPEAPFILRLFPNTKFVCMIRDGRASADVHHIFQSMHFCRLLLNISDVFHN